MTKRELSELIKQSQNHLHQNWNLLTPHKRDDLKHKIKLLKQKIRE